MDKSDAIALDYRARIKAPPATPGHVAKTIRTCALVKRKDIWQRQYMFRLCDDPLPIGSLTMSKHPVARLVGTPRWCGDDDAGELSTEHEWTWRLRLVLSLCLQYLYIHEVVSGTRKLKY